MTFQSKLSSVPTDAPDRMSIETFGSWAAPLDRRYELVGGVPRLQPVVKRSHSLIAGNIAFGLQTQIDRDRYAVHQGDFAIETRPDSLRYADVMVELLGASLDGGTAESAIMLVEILSESTMHVDFGAKAEEYLVLPSLKTYLIFDQTKPCAWQWGRNPDRSWPDEPVLNDGPDRTIVIEAIGAELRFADVYRNIR